MNCLNCETDKQCYECYVLSGDETKDIIKACFAEEYARLERAKKYCARDNDFSGWQAQGLCITELKNLEMMLVNRKIID